jgi:short-subunit dehydrogenase
MNNIALITGASSGIGKELAIIHAQNKGDLVLVARQQDKLEALKALLEKDYGIEVKIIAKDLTKREAAKEIFDEIMGEGIQVEYLINNAGFGGFGKFYERNMDEDMEMLDLNIIPLTQMTRLFLPEMIKRNSGRIMNLASIAAFMPGPLQAVYFATKAYVLSLSHAIATEIAGTKVTITALCPGPTTTNFAKYANMENSKLFKNGATAQYVAAKGYKAMMKGKREIITDTPMKFLIKVIMPYAPLKMVLKQVMSMQAK